MKKIIVLFLLFTGFGYSQNPVMRNSIRKQVNQEQLDLIIVDFDKQKTQNDLELEVLKKTQPALFQRDSISSFIEIQRVDPNGVPIYYKLNNVYAAGISQVPALHNGKGSQKLTGKGMLIGILDGDVVFDRHREFITNSYNSRVKLLEIEFYKNHKSYTASQQENSTRLHATHVAGTLVASGITPKAKGIAPEAELYSYTWKDDYLKILDIARQGVLVSNHSYGIAAINDRGVALVPEDYFGTYNSDALNFDRVGYEFSYFQSVISAGNDRNDYLILNPSKQGFDLLLGFSNAKNPIVVGAVANGQTSTINQTYYSSYGPTSDLRVKPDIVAYGENVYSTAFDSQVNLSNQYKDDVYAVRSGTSMAAPVVSGILTLWQQWAIVNMEFPLKAASVKAIMIHTAKKMQAHDGPSAKYGWGLIQAHNGVSLLDAVQSGRASILEGSLFEGNTFENEVNLEHDSDKIIFTLVWTDPPAVDKIKYPQYKYDKDLVNDLDIQVLYNDQVHYPYKLNYDKGEPSVEVGVNDVDNVEKIEIFNARKGRYKVVITHKGEIVGKDQGFSLIVSDQHWQGLTGIENHKQPNIVDFIAWPNPTKNILNIEVPKNIVFKENRMSIFDANGRLFFSRIVSSTDRYKVEVGGFPIGMYFIIIESNGVQYRSNFIKN